MANDRLRDAVFRSGLTPASLADSLGVDPKTTERWISQGRLPYPKYRREIVALLREPESYLWPEAVTPARAAQIGESELIRTYSTRGAVPAELWQRLLEESQRRIGILVFGGLFLIEQNAKFIPTVQRKAMDGVNTRILLGDPNGSEVARRGEEEGIGDAMAAKVRNTLRFYRDLEDCAPVEVHFHNTTLYNSIFWFDDEMLVNTHILGVPAHEAPVLHLRRLEGGDIFDNYSRSFERVSDRVDECVARQLKGLNMARREHFNDPEAPEPNSIVAAVTVFVVDDEGRVLLIRRTDNDLWALPGGGQDFGEYIAETAARETREEAGVDIEVTDVVGIYTNPNHVVAYSDGEVRQQFSICFRARYLSGSPTTSDESSEVRWVPRDELDQLTIHPSMRLRIDHGYAELPRPYIG